MLLAASDHKPCAAHPRLDSLTIRSSSTPGRTLSPRISDCGASKQYGAARLTIACGGYAFIRSCMADGRNQGRSGLLSTTKREVAPLGSSPTLSHRHQISHEADPDDELWRGGLRPADVLQLVRRQVFYRPARCNSSPPRDEGGDRRCHAFRGYARQLTFRCAGLGASLRVSHFALPFQIAVEACHTGALRLFSRA